MSSPSFERFDYQLRSNKHIERKLIFDLLARSRSHVNFTTYRYVGLGSMWFADHRLAHRLLNIDDLVSIEQVDHAPRAEFNKPYGTVKVLPGLSHAVLPSWGDEDWARPMVVWMDYDGILDADVVGDMTLLCQRLLPESVLIVTVNAHFNSYRVNKSAVEAAARRGEKIDPRAIATLFRLLGNVVPETLLSNQTKAGQPVDVNEAEFAAQFADALLGFMEHKITISGRQEEGQLLRFSPLFNFCHKDGAEMITVGGAITTPDKKISWENVLQQDPLVAVSKSKPKHHRLDLIPITLREKLVLDSILPASDEDFERQADERGLKLNMEQAKRYRQYYRHFSIFVEAPV